MRERTAVRWAALAAGAGLALAAGGSVLGPEVWTSVVEGGVGNDYAYGVAIDGGGNVVSAGIVWSDPNYDGYLERRLPDGTLDWSYVLDNPATDTLDSKSADAYASVCTDIDGNVFVGGSVSGDYYGADGFWSGAIVQKFSDAGALQWTWKANASYGAWSRVGYVTTDTAGNVWAAGSIFADWGPTQHEWAVWKFDPSGNLQSGFPVLYNYSPSYTYADLAYAMAVGGDGSFVVAGCRGQADNADPLKRDVDWHVRKYAADRSLVWEDTFPGPANLAEYPRSVAIGADGHVYIAGYVNVGTNNSTEVDWDGRIVKYDGATGARLWTQTSGTAAGRNGTPYSIAIDQYGRLLVAGVEADIGAAEGSTVVSVRSLGDGALLAEEVYAPAANTGTYAMAQRAGRVALAGYENGPTALSLRTAVHEYTLGNAAPVFDTLPSAGTQLAAVGETVTFHAAASDPDGDDVTITWDFGDGTTATGANATHAWTTAGSKHVVATATDGKDETPGALDLVVGEPLAKPSLSVDLNFVKPTRDVLTLKCRLTLPTGFTPGGHTLTVDAGGVKRDFPLSTKGRAKTAAGSVVMTYSKKLKVWSLTVKLAKGDYAAAWADEGLVDATVKKVPVVVKTTVVLDDTARCAHLVSELYTAKQGKWGHLR